MKGAGRVGGSRRGREGKTSEWLPSTLGSGADGSLTSYLAPHEFWGSGFRV